MSSVLTGSTEARRISQLISWNYVTGFSIDEIWEGNIDAIIGKQGDVVGPARIASETQLIHEGGFARLIVRIAPRHVGLPDGPTIEARLTNNRITLDIFEHTRYRSLSIAQKNEIRAAIDERRDLDQTIVTSAEGLELFTKLSQNVTSFWVFQPVATIRFTAPLGFGFNVDYSNVGKIISPATMTGIWGATSEAASTLSSYLANAAGLIAGWYKLPPELETVAGGFQSVIYQYEYGLWDTDLYSAAS